MNPLKKLASETVIYGFSTILGRFINWLLVPFYSAVFLTSEYGIITHLMGYVSILMVLLTYGTETGFFRFGSRGDVNKVFSTLTGSLISTTLLFFLITFPFVFNLSSFLNISDHPEYIILLILTVAIDVISTIPFALLRMEGKAVKFGIYKIINILVNIGGNLFFLLLCPYLTSKGINIPFYDPEGGVVYVFISYLLATIVTLFLLLPTFKRFTFVFSGSLLRDILKYSFPIMIVSLAGIINTSGDKILMPHILGQFMSSEDALAMTGIYGANYKLSVLMYIFTQGFRFAFEPFFFNYSKNTDSKKVYSDVFMYFTGFGLIIVLALTCWLDSIKSFVLLRTDYYPGLVIVPWIAMAFLFQGMYYSLSLWYKLTDKTIYGAYMAIIGSAITILGNIFLLPRLGYIGSAYSIFACFLVMCILSLYLGHKYYPIDYKLKRIGFYIVLAIVIYLIAMHINVDNSFLTGLYRTPLLLLFIVIFCYGEMRFLFTKKFMQNFLHKN